MRSGLIPWNPDARGPFAKTRPVVSAPLCAPVGMCQSEAVANAVNSPLTAREPIFENRARRRAGIWRDLMVPRRGSRSSIFDYRHGQRYGSRCRRQRRRSWCRGGAAGSLGQSGRLPKNIARGRLLTFFPIAIPHDVLQSVRRSQEFLKEA